MSIEHNPARNKHDGPGNQPWASDDYWQALIDERAAGAFLGLTSRTMQAYRQRGGGPRYIAISSRCLRYRRINLRDWAESRMRASTSEGAV
jgi:hypothetical protein